MSTEIENDLEHLRTVAVSVEELRRATSRLEAYRDDMIRRLRSEGRSAIKLATVADLNRSRIYVILEAPGRGADDYHFADFAERLDEIWVETVNNWLDGGGVGDVEDYFPLEKLVERP